MNGISALMKETVESTFSASTMWGHIEKATSLNQEAGSQQTQNLMAL